MWLWLTVAYHLSTTDNGAVSFTAFPKGTANKVAEFCFHTIRFAEHQARNCKYQIFWSLWYDTLTQLGIEPQVYRFAGGRYIPFGQLAVIDGNLLKSLNFLKKFLNTLAVPSLISKYIEKLYCLSLSER